MTGEEAIKKIAKEIGQHTENCPWGECSKDEKIAAQSSAKFILALVKKYFKSAGWKSPEEMKEYVRLSEDQTPPETPEYLGYPVTATERQGAYRQALKDMKAAGFQKVELEEQK